MDDSTTSSQQSLAATTTSWWHHLPEIVFTGQAGDDDVEGDNNHNNVATAETLVSSSENGVELFDDDLLATVLDTSDEEGANEEDSSTNTGACGGSLAKADKEDGNEQDVDRFAEHQQEEGAQQLLQQKDLETVNEALLDGNKELELLDNGKDDDDDFFAENNQDGNLPEYLKDEFLQQAPINDHMTAEEYQQSQFDVHGISKPTTATSTSPQQQQQQQQQDAEMVNKALNELDLEIEKLKRTAPKLSEVYCLAETQSKEFVSQRNFRLMFLRCEFFDCKRAAKRIMHFFEVKEYVWGKDKLAQTITLNDFEPLDMEALRHGSVQLLPIRDHAGRAVVFNNLNHVKYKENMNQFRTFWYLVMTAVEDEQTQKNGMVMVQYKVGEQMGRNPKRDVLWKGALAQRAMPAMFSAFHVCFGRQSLPFVRILKFGLEYQSSQRVRVHEGSHVECLLALSTLGIPRYAVPVSASGEVTRENHLEWLKQRANEIRPSKAASSSSSSSSEKEDSRDGTRTRPAEASSSTTAAAAAALVVVPGNGDVLLGRGKRSQVHPGNIRYNLLLEDKLSDFNAADNKGKREIEHGIIAEVQKKGGQFLKRRGGGSHGDGSWEVVPEDAVMNKIAHDFRTIRKRLNEGSHGKKRDAN